MEAELPGGQEGVAQLAGAEFGIRAGARIIDSFVFLGVSLVGGLLAGVAIGVLSAVGLLPQSALSELDQGGGGFATFFWSAVAVILFHTVCEAVGNATPGKLICGLRVISEWRAPCTMGGAIIRNLAYWVDALFFGLVAHLAMKDSVLRQRHGDRWGGTIVLKVADIPPEARRSGALVALGLVGATCGTAIFLALGLVLGAIR